MPALMESNDDLPDPAEHWVYFIIFQFRNQAHGDPRVVQDVPEDEKPTDRKIDSPRVESF